MKPKTTVRLIHHRLDRFCSLYLLLEEPGIKVVRAWCAKEAESQLREIPCNEPRMTDTLFSDGDWAEAPDAVGQAVEPAVSVTTVGPVEFSRPCLDTIDHGTFDLITGPLTVLQSGLC